MGHVFMPGHLVFPGGRLDPSDLSLAKGFAMPAEAHGRLMARTHSRFSVHHPAALALAAIRETFEETGVLFGQAAPFRTEAPVWREFAEAGVRPTPGALVPLARAITPPGHPRRFDTRFFVSEASRSSLELDFRHRPTDEFDEVLWVDRHRLALYDVAPVTRAVFHLVLQRLADGSEANAAQAIPFWRTVGGRHQSELI